MTVLIILAMVASVLLVLVVLAQNSKGGGLSSTISGGSGASNIIGVKKTGDILERLTWAFAIAIMLFSLAVNLLDAPTGSDDILDKVRNERLQSQPKDNSIPNLNTTPADTAK